MTTRTRDEAWLEAWRNAPMPATVQPIRTIRDVLYEQAVASNPRREGESLSAWLERVNSAAGVVLDPREPGAEG